MFRRDHEKLEGVKADPPRLKTGFLVGGRGLC